MRVKVGQVRRFMNGKSGFEYEVLKIIDIGHKNYAQVKITRIYGGTVATVGHIYEFPEKEVEAEELLYDKNQPRLTNYFFKSKNNVLMETKIKNVKIKNRRNKKT